MPMPSDPWCIKTCVLLKRITTDDNSSSQLAIMKKLQNVSRHGQPRHNRERSTLEGDDGGSSSSCRDIKRINEESTKVLGKHLQLRICQSPTSIDCLLWIVDMRAEYAGMADG
jgi:hypothetical protein